MTLSFADTIGQCDSLRLISEANLIAEMPDTEGKANSLSILVKTLIDQKCYEVAFGQQIKKVKFSRDNFPYHVEYRDLVYFDSLVSRYSPKMEFNVRDSFLSENLIAWADFNERTGHHSKTLEKFELYKSKYFADSDVLPDDLMIAAEQSFRSIGNEYYGNKEYGIAIEYFNEARDISAKMTNEESRLARGAINLGYLSYISLRNENAPTSKSIFFDHLNLTKKLFGLDEVYLGHLLTSYRNLANLHLANNNLDSAKYYVEQSIFMEDRYNRSQKKSSKIKARIFLKEENLIEAQIILGNLFEDRHQNNDPSKYIHFKDNLEIAELLIDANMLSEAKTLLAFIENINNERIENDDSNHPKYYSNKNIYLDISLSKLQANDHTHRDSIAIKIMKAYEIIDEHIEKAISREAKLNFASHSAQFTEFFLESLSKTNFVDADDIFYAMESSKAATSFKSWLQNQLVNLENDESLMFAEQEIENRLEKIRVELAKPIDSLQMQQLNGNIALSNSKLDSIKALLAEHHPVYYKMKYNWSIPSLSEVQMSLSDDEVLINYYEGEEKLYASVIATDYNYTIEIDSVSILQDSILKYFQKIQTEKLWTRSHSTISNYVYQKILAPLNEYLKDRIIISPSGSLFQVPFAALNTSPERDSLNYLIYDHAISYVSSCSFFYQLRNMNEKNNVEHAVLIAPKFNKPIPSIAKESKATTFNSKYAMRSSLYPLEYNVPEVQAISKYVNNDLLINEYATKASALDLMSNADIIHLATHAKSNMDSPDKSFVAFYKSNLNEEDDVYKWYLDDISKRPLPAKMIVLSACEASLGQVFKGEGAMSLANSCFYAGAHSVVASHWSAADNSTFELMKSMYGYLDQGMPKDEALQKSQINYLKNNSGIATNPFFWAGFSVMGNTDPLVFKKSPNYRNWIFALFGVVALFLLYPQLKREVI